VLQRLVGKVPAQAFAPKRGCSSRLVSAPGPALKPSPASTATEVDPRATILAVDAAGAYDHVACAAMLEALRERAELHPLPYVRQVYATQSVYTWVDAQERTHDILR